MKGYYKLRATLVVSLALASFSIFADKVVSDDQVVKGSLCVGFDCVDGENFNYDTIRLKENNVRIKFDDTSSSSSFPHVDWQLTANDSSNGGQNHFSIEDITNSKVPFRVMANAPTSSIHIHSSGNVGFGTSTPLTQVHTRYGNSPALRLEQDSSAGFSAQTWDVGGNETNFFIRDVTNGSRIPFKIVPNAANNSLFIAEDGDIGFGTSTPDGKLDIAHPSDVNNHALLVSPAGYLGVNIDNGSLPGGLLDVQTTGGVSRLLVAADGDVTISKDLTVTGTLTANIPAPLGFDTLSATSVVTSQDMTVSGDLDVVGAATFGGVVTATGIVTGSDLCTTTGLCLSNMFSSRSYKNVLDTVNHTDVLERLVNLPLALWTYKKDSDSIIHMGPMSEDFHAAFGLNGDTTDVIAKVDATGVSFAAIQALNEKVEQQNKQINELRKELLLLKDMLKQR